MVSRSNRSGNRHWRRWKQRYNRVLNRWESKRTSLKIKGTRGKMSSLAESKYSPPENVNYHVNSGTRPWKASRGLIEERRRRVCHGHDETVEHLVAGCTALSNTWIFNKTQQNADDTHGHLGERTQVDWSWHGVLQRTTRKSTELRSSNLTV